MSILSLSILVILSISNLFILSLVNNIQSISFISRIPYEYNTPELITNNFSISICE